MYAGAPGDPPEGSKATKVQEWLRRTNRDESVDPMRVLGSIVEGHFEADLSDEGLIGELRRSRKEKLEAAFARCGLRYTTGGVVGTGLGTATQTLEDLIRGRDISALDEEFARAVRNVEASPREAVSAACNILESTCKVYIADEHLTLPAKQDLQGVWGVVRKDLGLDASVLEDQDLKQIISGLLSVVSGIGALRTHASSAHGRGRNAYRLEPRHARLAIHAAHTVVAFVLETWDRRKGLPAPRTTESEPVA
jgi:hypothetical protein